MFLESQKIKAFPLGRPRDKASSDITSRIFYEQTVSNIIRQLITVKGFLITAPESIYNGVLSSGTNLEFNLGGYYFNVASGTSILPKDNAGCIIDETKDNKQLKGVPIYLYAAIKLSSSEPYEIIGQDVKLDGSDFYEYQGLNIIASEDGPDKFNAGFDYYIPIYTGATNSNGDLIDSRLTVYHSSFYKFSLNDIRIDGIDGRHN